MQNAHSPAHFEVLLVEDTGDELETNEATLAQANLPINLRFARGGETLALLHQEGDFHDAPRPNLILLDFHLQINALDLLMEIKHDQDLRDIPVGVLGPCSEEAIDESFEHSADVYIAKPLDPQRLMMTMNWTQGL
jgi:two-component system, chemotaxis family, response regulator Rcp1